MDKKDYIKLLKDNKKCNFIGLSITPWHFIGIESSILFLEDRNIKTNGIIFKFSHVDTGKCNNELLLNRFNDDFKTIFDVFPKDSIKRKIENLMSVFIYLFQNNRKSEPFYVVCPAKPAWMWIDIIKKVYGKRRIVFIIVDEGIGSAKFQTTKGLYFAKIENKKEKEISIFKRTVYMVLSFMESTFSSMIIYFFKKRNQYINNNLVNIKRNKFVYNYEPVKYYREVFESSSIGKCNDIYNEKTILINPGLKEEDDDFINSIYRKCTEIVAYKDIKSVIKPHPRDNDIERFNAINCYIEKNRSISQESLVASMSKKPICVISISSTTLITLKMIFNVNGISLAKIVKKHEKDNRNISNLNYFIEVSKGIVSIPEDIKELEKVLIEEVRNYETQ